MSTTTDHRRPVPAIDPRIRARRIAVRRDEGRHRLRLLGAGAGLLAVVAAAVGTALSPALDVDHVVVAGVARTSAADVVAASGIRRGDALATVDLGAAESSLEALPWVRGATVVRSWPGTVEVAVVERTPVAGFVRLDGRALLADADGRLLEVVDGGSAGGAFGGGAAGAVVVPPVQVHGLGEVGEPGRSADGVARAALDLAAALPADVVAVTEHIDAAGELALVLRLPDGGTARVLVGEGAVRDKVTAIATLLALGDLAGVDVIDVRVPATPTVTRGS